MTLIVIIRLDRRTQYPPAPRAKYRPRLLNHPIKSGDDNVGLRVMTMEDVGDDQEVIWRIVLPKPKNPGLDPGSMQERFIDPGFAKGSGILAGDIVVEGVTRPKSWFYPVATALVAGRTSAI